MNAAKLLDVRAAPAVAVVLVRYSLPVRADRPWLQHRRYSVEQARLG